jgi:hypothetical protein
MAGYEVYKIKLNLYDRFYKGKHHRLQGKTVATVKLTFLIIRFATIFRCMYYLSDGILPFSLHAFAHALLFGIRRAQTTLW